MDIAAEKNPHPSPLARGCAVGTADIARRREDVAEYAVLWTDRAVGTERSHGGRSLLTPTVECAPCGPTSRVISGGGTVPAGSPLGIGTGWDLTLLNVPVPCRPPKRFLRRPEQRSAAREAVGVRRS